MAIDRSMFREDKIPAVSRPALGHQVLAVFHRNWQPMEVASVAPNLPQRIEIGGGLTNPKSNPLSIVGPSRPERLARNGNAAHVWRRPQIADRQDASQVVIGHGAPIGRNARVQRLDTSPFEGTFFRSPH